MKKILPIILIFLLILISVYSFIKQDKEIDIPQIVIEEEDVEKLTDTFEEGNLENSAGASTFYIENIDFIVDYLNLDMMLRYRDMLTIYSINLPKIITENPEEFYEVNKEMLFDNYGIYDLDEFKVFNQLLLDAGVKTDSIPSYVKINNITIEGNLLKVDFHSYFDNAEVNLKHYINYVYIKGEESLFIYNLGVID